MNLVYKQITMKIYSLVLKDYNHNNYYNFPGNGRIWSLFKRRENRNIYLYLYLYQKHFSYKNKKKCHKSTSVSVWSDQPSSKTAIIYLPMSVTSKLEKKMFALYTLKMIYKIKNKTYE